MQIGLLGGTFCPIHYGHLRLGEEVLEHTPLEQIWFIPNGRPPHRDTPQATAQARWQMVQLAVSDNPRFAASDIELKSNHPSYTYETVASLVKLYPQHSFSFITGIDSITHSKWRYFDQLLELLQAFYVLPRPGYSREELELKLQAMNLSKPERIIFLDSTPLVISSSDIRRLLAEKRSIRYLSPEPVCRYISEQHLF